ncbi:MAG: SpoIIE family protein phosphatase [Solirubrobacterales bacterium]
MHIVEPPIEPDAGVTEAAAEDARRGAHFEALVESSEDAFLSKDTRGVITTWNPAAERLYGYSAEEAIGEPITLIIPEDRAGEEKEILARVLDGDRIEHYETERERKDGRKVPISLAVSPISDGGEIVGASVVARDMSERIARRERAARLQQLTSALARQAEPEEALRVLLSYGPSAVGADTATIGMLDPAGERVVLADETGHSPEVVDEWQSFPLEAELPVCAAIRELTSIWSRTPEDLKERFPAVAEERLQFDALAVLPLVAEGRALGAVSFSFTEPRQFSDEEKAFAIAIVQQAANTLERARIYEAERRAAERLSFLANASQILNEQLDLERTLERLAEVSVRLMSDWCSVDIAQPDGSVENLVIEHVDRSKAELAKEFRRRFPPDPEAPRGLAQVIRSGEPELYERIDEGVLREVARSEEHLAIMRELGLSSAVIVPLIVRGRSLGAITFASSDPERLFSREDLELAQDLARRAALAMDTSALYHREHETAVTLQRALLPGDLPEVEGVELAARYLPAEAGLEVGGDWFDLIESGPERLDVVIGDVAGRGVHAAAVMGRLAMALRAYVVDGRPVEEAVAGLDRLMKTSDPAQMATLFELSLDPVSGRARYVRAGHPPGLVRTPDGEVAELAGEGSPPLGPLVDSRFVANETTLPPGSALLLYTDGLIERRQLDLQVGVDWLKEVFAAAPDDPDSIVDAIARAVDAEHLPDDVALLVVRRSG